jgi:hypothetical protein
MWFNHPPHRIKIKLLDNYLVYVKARIVFWQLPRSLSLWMRMSTHVRTFTALRAMDGLKNIQFPRQGLLSNKTRVNKSVSSLGQAARLKISNSFDTGNNEKGCRPTAGKNLTNCCRSTAG